MSRRKIPNILDLLNIDELVQIELDALEDERFEGEMAVQDDEQKDAFELMEGIES